MVCLPVIVTSVGIPPWVRTACSGVEIWDSSFAVGCSSSVLVRREYVGDSKWEEVLKCASAKLSHLVANINSL